MKMRKVLAGLLTATTVMSTMFVPTLAATIADTAVNLTNYLADYSTVVDISTGDGVADLSVRGASASWAYTPMTEEEAKAVTWTVVDGGTVDVDINSATNTYVDYDAEVGYYAGVYAMVSANSTPGFASVRATNKYGNSMDFTVVVNGAVTSAKDIEVRFYDARDAETLLATTKCGTVSGNDYYGLSTYASALDTPAASVFLPNSPVTYSYVDPSQNMLTKLTINGNEYNADISNWAAPGWQYRVYDSAGNIKSLSENVGADAFGIADNDIVVWKYGTYAGTTFTNTITVN